MNCTALPSLLALALVGCFNPVAPSNGERSIDGELRIEVQLPPANEQGVAPETFVYLGDGSRHLQRLGEDGRAAFTDPSLTGPQDITVVWAYPQADGKYSRTNVYTALEVNRREVYVDPDLRAALMPSLTKPVTVTGRVTGLSDDPYAVVVVRAFSGERRYGGTSRETHGEGFAGGVFEFSMVLTDVPEGPLTFLAYEMRASDSSARRAGLVKSVEVRTSENDPVEIAITPFATENIRVEERTGSQASIRATVSVFQGGIGLFETAASGTAPVEVPALSLEGEWAGLRRTACLSDSPASGNQWSFAATPLGEATTVSLDLYDFPTILEPPITGQGEPVVVAATEPLELVWKADTRATAVRAVLSPEMPGVPGATHWEIEAPASRGVFRAQRFPEALAHLKLEMKGKYVVWLDSMGAERVTGYSERFVHRPAEGNFCAALDGGSHSYASTRGSFVRE